MTEARWERIQEIFQQALQRPPEERAEYIREALGDDAELRAEVESLLVHHDQAGPDLWGSREVDSGAETIPASPGDRPGPEPDPDRDARIGQVVGHYHIKSVIASGGMGTVYLAVQERPRRTVALKLMKKGIASRSSLRRFEYESQILGRLRHANIAQVHEAGTHDDGSGGVPYFAMEYIPNAKTITEYVASKKLGTRKRLELFAKVCDAVHHGHQKGIIHRDLKPGNILIDSSGEPKIIDFGVARSTDSDMAVTTIQTDVGQLIGTLQYMSPEQCDADPHDLDTRSDVYALGVILYEMICEQLPYEVSRAALHEAARVIREEAPTKPSTINRTLRGDVETIALKALEKDRDRRYQSAADLEQDIRRYLRSEPIEARPPSVVYRVRTFAKRNKAAFAVLVTLLVAVPALTAATIVSLEATRRARVARVALSAEKAGSDLQRDAAEFQAYVASIAAAAAAIREYDTATARRHLGKAPSKHRNWEWHYLNRITNRSLVPLRVELSTTPPGWVFSEMNVSSFSPDGARLASGTYDGTIRLWDTSSGAELAILPDHEKRVESLAFSLDGARLASGSADGMIRLWDASTGESLKVLPGHESSVSAVCFSSDGEYLTSGSRDGTVRRWDASSGAELTILWRYEGWPESLAFSPDGTRVGVTDDGAFRLWDISSREELVHMRGRAPFVFSPDGTRLALSEDGGVRLCDVSPNPALLRGHVGSVSSVLFSSDGTRLASGSHDFTIRVWNVSDGAELVELSGHEGWVNAVSLSPDGTRLAASVDYEETVRVWDARPR